MKPAGYLLLIPAGLITVSEAATGLVSAELKAHVREGLPAYRTPAAPSADDESPIFSDRHADTDPNLLVLPKLTVKEKRLPSDAADHLMSPREFNRKMRNLYDDELAKDGPLQSFLNGFTIPLLSPSRAAKGRAIYLSQEIDRLAGLLSPEEAKSLNGFYDEIALTVGRRAPKRR